MASSAKPMASTNSGMPNIAVSTDQVPDATASPAFSDVVIAGSSGWYFQRMRAEPMPDTMSASTDRVAPVLDERVEGFFIDCGGVCVVCSIT